jgi:hypothetical protein
MANDTAWIERVCAGIEFCVQKGVDVINLSLGPCSTEFHPDDPLLVATKVAYDRNIPVVVAAGNFGPGKLQALAQAPWVISVGAVDDDGRLLPDSSTGPLGGKGPTVVSYGSPPDLENPDPQWEKFGPGTSFAAARVANVAAFVRACLRLTIADLTAQQSNRWSPMSEPIKVPVIGIVDTGVDPKRLPPLPPFVKGDLLQFSRGDTERQWYARIVEALRNAGAACTLTDGPESVRRALQLMARRLEGYATHEVGAGLVSIAEAQAFLSSLTPARWLGIFCPEAVQKLGAARVAELDTTLGPLWDPYKVFALKIHLSDGVRLVVAKVY